MWGTPKSSSVVKLRLALQMKARRALIMFVRLHRSLINVGRKYAVGGSRYNASIHDVFRGTIPAEYVPLALCVNTCVDNVYALILM